MKRLTDFATSDGAIAMQMTGLKTEGQSSNGLMERTWADGSTAASRIIRGVSAW